MENDNIAKAKKLNEEGNNFKFIIKLIKIHAVL